MVTSNNLTHLYKDWQATASAKDVEFVDSVFALCEKNYEAGGDVVVECLGPQDILEKFKSLDEVREYCGLLTENATNFRWGEDTDPEVNRPAWQD